MDDKYIYSNFDEWCSHVKIEDFEFISVCSGAIIGETKLNLPRAVAKERLLKWLDKVRNACAFLCLLSDMNDDVVLDMLWELQNIYDESDTLHTFGVFISPYLRDETPSDKFSYTVICVMEDNEALDG